MDVIKFIAEGKLRLALRPNSDVKIKELMEQCLKANKYERPEFSKICEQITAAEYEVV